MITTSPGNGARAAVPDHLEHFLSAWAPLRSEIDPADVQDLTNHVRQMIAAIAAVENDAPREVRKIRAGGFTRHPDIAEFLPIWLTDELAHGEAISTLSRLAGSAPSPEGQHTAFEKARERGSLSALKLSRVIPGMTITYLVLGVAAERLTDDVYRALARQTEGSVRDTMLDIARQERLHMTFYLQAARFHAQAAPSEARYARRILRRFWRPVGVDRLGLATWIETFRPLWTDPAFVERMRLVDHTIDTIPGLEGLGLMAGFLDVNKLAGVA